MRKLLSIFAICLTAAAVFASEWDLIRVSEPANPSSLYDLHFQLFSREGGYWIGAVPSGVKLPAGAVKLDEFDLNSGEYYSLSVESPQEIEKLTGFADILYREGNYIIIQAKNENLRSMPRLKAFWKHIDCNRKPMTVDFGSSDETEQFHPLVNEFVSEVSQTQYIAYVQSLQDVGTRNTITQGCNTAGNWILQQFQNMGLTTTTDPFTISSYTRYNIVGELIGQTYPDSIIFITGHYDATAGYPWSQEPNTPGADDNGSGVACVLESARILSQYDFAYTIRFVAFAGEEQGLYGSEDYVNNLVAQGARVKGCFNYDMIAYSGNDPLPPDLMIYSNNSPRSIAMAEKLEEAALTFTPGLLEPWVDIDPSVTYSDHSPFWDAGMPAILGIEEEAWGADFNPYYHTVQDLVTNCDMDYAVNVTKAAIAALGDYASPIITSGPALMVTSYQFTEITGNGNGAADPGEIMGLTVTLTNVGVDPAAGISAILNTTNQYLTISQNNSSYPNLNPQQAGNSVNQYVFSISASCPQNYTAGFTLNISAGGGYTGLGMLSVLVGDPVYSPQGPDQYGYSAFDIVDAGGPEFSWIEIDPVSGGAGTQINFTNDDQTVTLPLPFTFTYYGQDYTQVSVCTNGWLAMGQTTDTDYSNSQIPNNDGPPRMIAPFWDDLSPQVIGSVSHYYDSTEHVFIVEYLNVRQYSPTSAFESFQVILYDPIHFPTSTGDGQILFQYLDVTDPSSCTVGIENHNETVGLQYLYNNSYDIHSYPIGDSTAILFSTFTGGSPVTVTLTPFGTPIQIPTTGGSFNFNIAVQNNSTAPVNFDVWCNVTLPNGNIYGPVLGPVDLNINPGIIVNRDRTQAVPQGAPGGIYSYNAYAGTYPDVIWSQASFPFEKMDANLGIQNDGWDNWGDEFGIGDEQPNGIIPSKFSLNPAYPNPFNPQTSISFEIPARSYVSLKAFDILGRNIAVLAEGYYDAGAYTKTFSGSELASGIYFIRLETEKYTANQKILLIK